MLSFQTHANAEALDMYANNFLGTVPAILGNLKHLRKSSIGTRDCLLVLCVSCRCSTQPLSSPCVQENWTFTTMT